MAKLIFGTGKCTKHVALKVSEMCTLSPLGEGKNEAQIPPALQTQTDEKTA